MRSKTITLILAFCLTASFAGALATAAPRNANAPGYTTHDPIRINSESEFNSLFPGREISGYDIDGTGAGVCILIGNC